MPRKPMQSPIQCEYFTWRLFHRDGVYYADGRGGRDDLGKHSLGTRELQAALQNLRRLDCQLAIERGLAEKERTTSHESVSIATGWALFMEDRGRPQVLGGVGKSSLKRYRAVRDKHATYCETTGIRTWDRVDRASVVSYGSWLHRRYDSAPATVLLELNTVCSVLRWLSTQRHIPESCRFSLAASQKSKLPTPIVIVEGRSRRRAQALPGRSGSHLARRHRRRTYDGRCADRRTCRPALVRLGSRRQRTEAHR